MLIVHPPGMPYQVQALQYAVRCPRPPDERANICTYLPVYLKAMKGNSYACGTTLSTCTQDSCYTEVVFNTIMHYVLSNGEATEKQYSTLQYMLGCTRAKSVQGNSLSPSF
jgi:hypothetical protein